MMNFKPYISPLKQKDKFYCESYVLTCDLSQKDTYKLKGTDIELQMNRKYNPDHRLTHPTIGTIVASSEDSQFKVGDKVMCKHFTFENDRFETKEFYTDEAGVKYFKASRFDIMFGIDGDNLIPRKGILLCEDVTGKFANTSIELSSVFEGKRRDIAKVLKVWEGCTEYKVGDYVMLKFGADYRFEFGGKTYVKVDHLFNDVYAITDSSETYDSVIHKHADHYKSTDSIQKEIEEKGSYGR